MEARPLRFQAFASAQQSIGDAKSSDRFDRVFTQFSPKAARRQILADRDRRAAVWMDFQGAEHLRGLFIHYAALPFRGPGAASEPPAHPVVGPPDPEAQPGAAGAGSEGPGPAQGVKR